MSSRMDALAQVLFNKPSLEACSLQQVDYLAHQYPYFSTAQLLLLQKAEPGSEVYNYQLQRTALQFSNPLQLHHALHPALFETDAPEQELFQTPMLVETAGEALQEAVLEEVNTTNLESELETVAATPPQSIQTPAKAEENAQAEVLPLAFEPYHTVDYFASQGIKLSQQEAVNDKLGKQLKSFTEWLKTMKRLPEAAVVQPTDAGSERKVENLAAHSLDTADVVTESMAEVWLKQGNKEKAADVYNKLRLQHPAKSAYFAAKIEALKKP